MYIYIYTLSIICLTSVCLCMITHRHRAIHECMHMGHDLGCSGGSWRTICTMGHPVFCNCLYGHTENPSVISLPYGVYCKQIHACLMSEINTSCILMYITIRTIYRSIQYNTYISKRHTHIKYAHAFSTACSTSLDLRVRDVCWIFRWTGPGGEDVTVSCPAHELTQMATVSWPYVGRQHVW